MQVSLRDLILKAVVTIVFFPIYCVGFVVCYILSRFIKKKQEDI